MARMFFFNSLASLIWSSLSALARACARPRSLGVRTIAVGNIQAGGAGKTPLVARIAREAGEKGLTVCILCRGYGGSWEARGGGGVIAPGEAVPETELCGDEAALLHELAPRAWIGIGADRCAQLGRVRARTPDGKIDLVILDDGFQHHRIRRDLDIVALTSARPGERLFRDFPWMVRRAALLVWTKGERRPRSFGAPMIRARFRVPKPDFASSICLVTGLADGEAARKAALEAGYRVERHIPFPDHARYAETDVRSIFEEARARGLKVATTGKDWVKWREMGIPGDSVLVLEPQIELEEQDREIWERVLWG